MIALLVVAAMTMTLYSCAAAQSAAENAQADHHAWLPFGADKIPPEDRAKMPLPFGISLNYYSSKETFKLSNAAVSLNGQTIPTQAFNLESVSTVTNSRTLRADAWILPFLDIYYVNGTFRGEARDIEAEVLGPPLPIPQTIPFNGRQSGIGATLAGGYKQFFASYDWNTSWAKLNLANVTIPTVTQGPRIGVQFGSSEAPIRVYVGGFHEAVRGRVSGGAIFQNLGQLDYDLKATPETAWNFIVGAQVEAHKRSNLNIEYGMGKRKQTRLSYTQRF